MWLLKHYTWLKNRLCYCTLQKVITFDVQQENYCRKVNSPIKRHLHFTIKDCTQKATHSSIRTAFCYCKSQSKLSSAEKKGKTWVTKSMSAWGVLNHKFKKKEEKDRLISPSSWVRTLYLTLRLMCVRHADKICTYSDSQAERSVKYAASNTKNELRGQVNYSDMAFGLSVCTSVMNTL